MKGFRKRKRAEAVSISIIGGADGPTSVFIAGKPERRSFIEKIRQRRYLRKKKRAASLIRPKSHTFEEVEAYLKDVYNAVELPKESSYYQEQYKCEKESLLMNYRPELLGELSRFPKLRGRDRASIEEFIRRAEKRSEAAQAVSNELFPVDFHLYRIHTRAGRIEFSMDRIWGMISCSYSGKKGGMKRLRAIYKDVYLYYGVTKEDIRNKTKRYQELLTVLAD